MRILLIAPLVDIPTIVSNLAIFEILAYADTKPDIDIDYLPGIMANRFMYNLYTTFKKYDLIIYYGHGEKDRLMGNHFYWSIINKKNVRRTNPASFDTMACHSAAGLGMLTVKQGTKAYIGTTDLYYAAFPEKEYNFLRSWIDYTTIKTKALLDGKTFGEAYKAFLDTINKYITLYEQNIGYKNYDWYLEKTIWNRDHTILLGDPDTKII